MGTQKGTRILTTTHVYIERKGGDEAKAVEQRRQEMRKATKLALLAPKLYFEALSMPLMGLEKSSRIIQAFAELSDQFSFGHLLVGLPLRCPAHAQSCMQESDPFRVSLEQFGMCQDLLIPMLALRLFTGGILPQSLLLLTIITITIVVIPVLSLRITRSPQKT